MTLILLFRRGLLLAFAPLLGLRTIGLRSVCRTLERALDPAVPAGLQVWHLVREVNMARFITHPSMIAQSAQLVWDTYCLTVDDRNLTTSPSAMLFRACIVWNCSVAEWLMAQFPDHFSSFRCQNVLRRACQLGNLDAAKWLVARFNIEYLDIEDREEDEIIYATCEAGHLAVAQWLHQTFKVAFGLDIYREKQILASSDTDYELFVSVCARGHIDVARWLQKVAPADEVALRRGATNAYANGFEHIALWLARDYLESLSVWQLLWIACKKGDLKTIRRLTRLYYANADASNMTSEEVDSAIKLLYHAANYGHLAVVRWLAGALRLRGKIRKGDAGAMMRTVRHNDHAMARWLRRFYR